MNKRSAGAQGKNRGFLAPYVLSRLCALEALFFCRGARPVSSDSTPKPWSFFKPPLRSTMRVLTRFGIAYLQSGLVGAGAGQFRPMPYGISHCWLLVSQMRALTNGWPVHGVALPTEIEKLLSQPIRTQCPGWSVTAPHSIPRETWFLSGHAYY